MAKPCPKSTAAFFGAITSMQNNEAQPRFWLAAYTRSRHEHQVATQLQQKNVEYLLPSYNKMRRFPIPQGTGRAGSELPLAAEKKGGCDQPTLRGPIYS